LHLERLETRDCPSSGLLAGHLHVQPTLGVHPLPPTSPPNTYSVVLQHQHGAGHQVHLDIGVIIVPPTSSPSQR
jgi:hypothetical protein